MSGQHDVEFWGKYVDRAEKLEKSNQSALDDMKKGKKPPKKCDFKGSDSYQCVCVSEEDAKTNTTTNAKRKLNEKVGMMCLDAEGLSSEMAEHKHYTDDDRAKVAKGKTMSLAAMIGGPVVFLGGLVLIIGRFRKPKAPAVAPTPGA